MPLDLRAIEHPVYRHGDADIPCISWGKFGAGNDGRMAVPFAVQAHHVFSTATISGSWRNG